MAVGAGGGGRVVRGGILVIFLHDVVHLVSNSFGDGAGEMVVVVRVGVVVAYYLHVRFLAVLVDERKRWRSVDGGQHRRTRQPRKPGPRTHSILFLAREDKTPTLTCIHHRGERKARMQQGQRLLHLHGAILVERAEQHAVHRARRVLERVQHRHQVRPLPRAHVSTAGNSCHPSTVSGGGGGACAAPPGRTCGQDQPALV